MNFWRSRYDSQLQLSAEEMLEISQNIRRKCAPSASDKTPELVVLPIDPHHLHAYWNLVGKFADTAQHNGSDRQLTLRIYWHPDGVGENAKIAANRLWFDVELHSIQQQCRVRLPVDAAAYSAVIGLRSADYSFETLARSNLVQVPRSRVAPPRDKATEIKLPETGPLRAAAAHISPMPTYDETLVDATIREILRHQGSATLAPYIRNSNIVYDERRIDAAILETLHAKGFDQAFETTAPAAAFSVKATTASDKTHSGQGNRP